MKPNGVLPPSQSSRARKAFTLVEVMIVVGIVSLIASIAIPYFVTYRASAQAKTCVANLKQLQGAKEQWAMEQKRGSGDACDLSDIVGTDKYIRNPVSCPSGSGADYLIGAVGENPRCPTTLADHVLIP